MHVCWIKTSNIGYILPNLAILYRVKAYPTNYHSVLSHARIFVRKKQRNSVRVYFDFESPGSLRYISQNAMRHFSGVLRTNILNVIMSLYDMDHSSPTVKSNMLL